ncbi:ATPase [Candidatus Methylospira mobilis]|uniref:ATPase n=1 Tax=Candidatus Methylospira mobilis TaxID=1808979 RepID=A0A5Q0BRT4_9GAMM|nr:ATPase [Candidatus Methylospira mobilis]QFY44396.1 ATPase [Candidatus Methylospira mobilis]WNV06168.1 ATPase [Candidatus Methylospira mobilis]
MKLSVQQFKEWNDKSITLLGMSGVGKTRLSNMLRKNGWFHYSGDYRIGTRYLSEPILDNIKLQLMQIDLLRDLLRSDTIHITNNISVDNLAPVSTFLGKLGNPERGGLSLHEFKRRQSLHRAAEIAAMHDVPEFIFKAKAIYGYDKFINDAGGSLCELESPEVMDTLAKNTLIVYIRASKEDEEALVSRAQKAPKPLYYREAFLDEQLSRYMQEHELSYAALIDPDEFVRWIFPRLFVSRIPRYEALAEQYGYVVHSEEIKQVNSEADFLALLEHAIAREIA